jgi:hypothetical protein
MSQGLFELGKDFGCLTGDCPHAQYVDCEKAIEKYITELCDAGKKLQEELGRIKGLATEVTTWYAYAEPHVDCLDNLTAFLKDSDK